VKHKKFRKTWLEAFESLKNKALNEFGDEGFRNLKEKISKLATYHYNKSKYILLGQDKEFYEFLITNSYNPYTVYRWFLLERVPEDVRFQLRNGAINQKLASKIQFKRKHEGKNHTCIDIRLMGLNLVRSM